MKIQSTYMLEIHHHYGAVNIHCNQTIHVYIVYAMIVMDKKNFNRKKRKRKVHADRCDHEGLEPFNDSNYFTPSYL